ncbi:MAG: 16S rRNA processing protein RimM [Alphaproteobacteria bacterium]|nr:16S rRNA processing protein RimM [Alphaproteobacteria bacterium]
MAEDQQRTSEGGSQGDDRICVGVVTGVHGLKGLVKVKPFTDAPESVAAYGAVETEDGNRRLELEVANRAGKGQIAVRVAGVTDRDAAEALKGLRLYVPRERLPAPDPEEFYYADLIGLAVQRASGDAVGTVRAVFDFGAGDVLEIVDDAGALIMVPFTRDAVPEIDLEGGRIVVTDAHLDASDDAGEGDEQYS